MFRDRYTCRICHRRLRARNLEVDHIVELAVGGAPLDYLNLQTVCRRCHRAKTAGFLRQRRSPAGRAPPEPAPYQPLSDESEWGAAWFPS